MTSTSPSSLPISFPTQEQMEEALAVITAVRDSMRSGIDVEMPWKSAHAALRLMTPQQYGIQMERWLINHYGWTPVHKSNSRGDCVDSNGDHWEIKVSFLRGDRPSAQFNQIRPLEQLAGYQLFVVAEDGEVTRLVVTSDEMKAELKTLGSCTHGKSTQEARDAGAEQTVSFRWSDTSKTYTRWMGSYKVDGAPA